MNDKQKKTVAVNFTMDFVEKIISAVIDPLDDYDLPEEQRLCVQITDETRADVARLLISYFSSTPKELEE